MIIDVGILKTHFILYLTSGQVSISECLPCDGGMYCPHYGMESPFPNCSARYYCNESAVTATPTDGITGKYLMFYLMLCLFYDTVTTTGSSFVPMGRSVKAAIVPLQEMNARLDTTVPLALRLPFLASLGRIRTQHLMKNVYLAHLDTTASQDQTHKTVPQVQSLKYSVLSSFLIIKVQS